jgi:hypothetical protein
MSRYRVTTVPQYGFRPDFSGFLSIQGRSVRPRKIGQIVRFSKTLTEILDFNFLPSMCSHMRLNPKNGPKVVKSALKAVKKIIQKYAARNTKHKSPKKLGALCSHRPPSNPAFGFSNLVTLHNALAVLNFLQHFRVGSASIY